MRNKQTRITPAIAKTMLAKLAANRRIRPALVYRYAADMKAGRWKPTHQGIAFDKKGKLIDGQHRLQAIIESGCTVEMYCFYECDAESIRHVDQGGLRTVANVMQIIGVDCYAGNANLTACVARAMLGGINGHLVRIPRDVTLRCIEKYGEEIWAVLEECGGQTLRRGAAYAPIVKAVLEYEFDAMKGFCRAVRDNTFGHRRDPANVLVRWLNGAGRSGARHQDVYGRAVTAVRAHLEDRQLGSLPAATVDPYKPDLYYEFVPPDEVAKDVADSRMKKSLGRKRSKRRRRR